MFLREFNLDRRLFFLWISQIQVRPVLEVRLLFEIKEDLHFGFWLRIRSVEWDAPGNCEQGKPRSK
jgi:hypothetical protein